MALLKFNLAFGKCLTITTAVAVIVMMLHIVAHALMHSLFHLTIYGSNVIVEHWYLPLVALPGIPATQPQKGHNTVTMVTEKVHSSTSSVFTVFTVFTVFACALGALVSLGFAWFGLDWALTYMVIGQTADVSDIITWPLYFLVPIVFVLLAALYLMDADLIVRTGERDLDLVTGRPLEYNAEDATY